MGKRKRRKTNKNKKKIILVLAFVVCSFIIFQIFNQNENENQYKMAVYPMKYKESVEKYCEQYHVDKYLVYAMIKQESNFNSEAISKADAIGLMQITENTFYWLKAQLKETDTTFQDLFEPDTNIRYGVFFISRLQERFDNQDTVIAAYNAGMNITSKWLEDSNYSNDGSTLQNIPYGETARHVEIVGKNYNNYVDLYGK